MESAYVIEVNKASGRYDVRLGGILVFSDVRKDLCEAFVKEAEAALVKTSSSVRITKLGREKMAEEQAAILEEVGARR